MWYLAITVISGTRYSHNYWYWIKCHLNWILTLPLLSPCYIDLGFTWTVHFKKGFASLHSPNLIIIKQSLFLLKDSIVIWYFLLDQSSNVSWIRSPYSELEIMRWNDCAHSLKYELCSYCCIIAFSRKKMFGLETAGVWWQ